VPRVEIDERFWFLREDPDLAEHSRVNGAHELLAENIEAVGYVDFNDVLLVFEGTLSEFFVVVVVVEEAFAEKVLWGWGVRLSVNMGAIGRTYEAVEVV
jgi:hypothetical protein